MTKPRIKAAIARSKEVRKRVVLDETAIKYGKKLESKKIATKVETSIRRLRKFSFG